MSDELFDMGPLNVPMNYATGYQMGMEVATSMGQVEIERIKATHYELTPDEWTLIRKARADAAEKARTCRRYVIAAVHGEELDILMPPAGAIYAEPVVLMRMVDTRHVAYRALTLPRARELVEKLGLLISVAEAGR